MKIQLLIFISLIFGLTSVHANKNPFVVDLKYDIPLLGFAGLFFASAQNELSNMTSADYSRLKKSDLPDYERWITNQYSTTADIASNILAIGVISPMVLSIYDAKSSGQWNNFWTDFLIFTQAITISSAINLTVRSLGDQPRPYVYSDKTPQKKRAARSASSSFYSGHTSAAFLTATYTSYVFQTKNPGSPVSKWIWLGTHTIAAGVGALRIVAGKHFLKDVAVGACSGSLLGYLVPRIHLSKTKNLSFSVGMQHGMLAWNF